MNSKKSKSSKNKPSTLASKTIKKIAKTPAKKIISKKLAPKKKINSKILKKSSANLKKFKKVADAKSSKIPSAPITKKMSKQSNKQTNKSNASTKVGKKIEQTKSKKNDNPRIILQAAPKQSIEKSPKIFVRPSAGIYFSLSDLNNYFASKKLESKEHNIIETSSKKSSKKEVSSVVNLNATTKKTISPASIEDILGFNPFKQERQKFEEKDVPLKWKKYFKLLMDLRNKYAGTANSISSEILSENSDDRQGQDIADLGTENSERNLALSMLSSEQVILNEINAAISRIKNGTYGICEITNKPIPEKRLLSVPFARCTIEGQKQKESNLKKFKITSADQLADFAQENDPENLGED